MIRKVLKHWPMGSYKARLDAGAVDRPYYGLCLYQAAHEAKALGYKAITAVELGVAGGNGILSMCRHRDEIRKALGMEVHLLGFDSGTGLPSSEDPRDVRYYWPPGSFEMDREVLEKRLAGQADLIFGNVADTIPKWEAMPDAPLGAIMFDLDLYSSTTAALGLLTKQNLLPRVWCFFDDVIGYPENAFADGTGEREAIREFNLAPERKLLHDHLSPARVFKARVPEHWHQQIYLYHRLSHPQYNVCIAGEPKLQLKLDSA
ncbi:MAG: hypothetical protein WBQ94_20800 [Terracidiphilus sp.]